MKKILSAFIFVFSFFLLVIPTKIHADSNTITGTVFIDSNQNGIHDTGEQGYSGATIFVRQGHTTVQSITTDSEGNYTITDASSLLSTDNIILPVPNNYTETTKIVVQVGSVVNNSQNFGLIAIPNNSLLSQPLGLTGVACPKNNGISCLAVGNNNNDGAIWTTSDNTNWTSVQNIFTGENFTDINCPDQNGIFCVAVGEKVIQPTGGAISITTDGVNWKNATFTNNDNDGDLYTKVICPNAKGIFCIAVGDRSVNQVATISTTEDGVNWTQAPYIFNPPFQGISLNGISCPNTNGIFCIATGYDYIHGSGVILSTSDGTNWTSESVTAPGYAIMSIACPNKNGIFCVAVGPGQTVSNGIILTTTNGTNWTSIPGNFLTNNALYSVACPNNNGTLCIATGISSPTSPPFILTTSDGATWTATNWSSVTGLTTHTQLFSVSCSNDGVLCTAVGTISASTLHGAAVLTNLNTVLPTATPIQDYSLSGTVYNDNNQNGVEDTGENGYQGATVTLNTGQSTTTDARGDYSFTNLQSGTYTETLTVPDGFTASTTNPATVAVNADTTQNFGTVSHPVIGTLTTTPNPVKINSTLSTTASFTEGNTTDTHTATWNWGDGNTTTGTVTESNGSGTVANNHTYTSLGSYIVTATVTNNQGVSSTSQTVVSVIPTGGLQGGNLTGKNYSGADLSNQNMSGSNLSNGTFNNVNFSNANLSRANGSNGSFTSSNFTGASLQGGNFSNADFTGSTLTNANFTGANVSHANFTNADVTGATFTGANKSGIIWSNTICPNGQNSNAHNNSCAGQGGGL